MYGTECLSLDPYNVLHFKDLGLGDGVKHIDGQSRLETQKYPLSNLISVYEARNAIYVKRGAIGAIVSRKVDQSGSIPLTKTEKEQIQKDYNDSYGVTSDKSNTLITNVPVDFIRFNMSIQELAPFEETLADAVQIAGAFNVPSVLIPRKDQSTFSNQDAAEKSLYENVVIPETVAYCKALNSFLGLEKDGLYLDVSFDHIPVLQPNERERASTRKMISEACRTNFFSGNTIARGIPGKPAPVPTSITNSAFLTSSESTAMSESTKCFSINSSLSVIAVRLSFSFHSRTPSI